MLTVAKYYMMFLLVTAGREAFLAARAQRASLLVRIMPGFQGQRTLM